MGGTTARGIATSQPFTAGLTSGVVVSRMTTRLAQSSGEWPWFPASPWCPGSTQKPKLIAKMAEATTSAVRRRRVRARLTAGLSILLLRSASIRVAPSLLGASRWMPHFVPCSSCVRSKSNANYALAHGDLTTRFRSPAMCRPLRRESQQQYSQVGGLVPRLTVRVPTTTVQTRTHPVGRCHPAARCPPIDASWNECEVCALPRLHHSFATGSGRGGVRPFLRAS
jgi:hypothetical protein